MLQGPGTRSHALPRLGLRAGLDVAKRQPRPVSLAGADAGELTAPTGIVAPQVAAGSGADLQPIVVGTAAGLVLGLGNAKRRAQPHHSDGRTQAIGMDLDDWDRRALDGLASDSGNTLTVAAIEAGAMTGELPIGDAPRIRSEMPKGLVDRTDDCQWKVLRTPPGTRCDS